MPDLSKRGPVVLDYPKYSYQFSEFFGIGDNGNLWCDGCDVDALADEFGTPLHVFSENQFRHNYRRFRDAFQAHYPDVKILFANKSNNGLAMRHIMNQEGAGGDCFGHNEMYIALLAGTDPKALVLNGSNKEADEIELAVTNGVCINIDAMDEVDVIHETANRLGRDIEVGIRAKLELPALEDRFGRGVHSGSMAEIVWGEKWGMPYEQTVELVKRIRSQMNNLHPVELHFHLSRLDNQAKDFAEMAREMVQWCAHLRDDTGWTPPAIDLGGGWTFGRKEKTGALGGVDDETVSSFENYGAEVASAVKDECAKHGLGLPTLKIEPGRSISGMAGIAVGRVGAVKTWAKKNHKWVNVDLSGNHVPWISIPHHYHIVAANKASAPATETVDIVGPICTHDVLGHAREMPELVRGDTVALLDTGCYAESTSANFNAQCRPATVLVCGADAEVVTERERLEDVMGRFRIPSRLIAQSYGDALSGAIPPSLTS
ncbi:MAG: alanine racemase [Rhodospirillales bacterium]|nr:alanine racemase [Rhodospirillales bacterium]